MEMDTSSVLLIKHKLKSPLTLRSPADSAPYSVFGVSMLMHWFSLELPPRYHVFLFASTFLFKMYSSYFSFLCKKINVID